MGMGGMEVPVPTPTLVAGQRQPARLLPVAFQDVAAKVLGGLVRRILAAGQFALGCRSLKDLQWKSSGGSDGHLYRVRLESVQVHRVQRRPPAACCRSGARETCKNRAQAR